MSQLNQRRRSSPVLGGSPSSSSASDTSDASTSPRSHDETGSLTRLLSSCPHLVTLRFSGSLTGALEVPVMEALLTTSNTLRLRRLSLSRLGLFPFNASVVAKALCSDSCQLLEELDLSYNGLRDEGVTTIFRAVAGVSEPSRRRRGPMPHRLRHLRTLDLSQNQAGAWGLKGLASALANGAMPGLVTLLLAGNNVREDGGAVLAGKTSLFLAGHFSVAPGPSQAGRDREP